MLSFLENGAVCKNIFRLAAVLCMAYAILPGYEKKQQKTPTAEYGIGGGILYEEVFSGTKSGIVLTPASIESVVPELEALSKPRILLYDSHVVESGEVIGRLAINFGLNQDSIISANKISNTRLLQTGKVLRIPNQDGILHTVEKGDTLGSIAEKYKIDWQTVKIVNELFSTNVVAGTDLFIPGARLDAVRLQEINGDLFIWPVSGVITSPYGYRRDPFNSGRRQFHTGIDIRGSMGTPVKAAMAGRVSQVGYDNVLGNFVLINHHSGYRTLYAHLSAIKTRTGVSVGIGEHIGDVGSTGLSTGPHLHFMVYKNGVTVNPRALMR